MKCSTLLQAITLIAFTIFSQPVIQASGQSEPQPGDYIVAEQGSNDLVRITPAGSKAQIIGNLSGLTFVAIDSQGNYIVVENGDAVLSKVTPTGHKTVIYEGRTVCSPFCNIPSDVAVDAEGNYIVTEGGETPVYGWVSKITPTGSRRVIIGNLTAPTGVAIDSEGNYIVAEYGFRPLDPSQPAIPGVLSKITPSGSRTVITGNLSGPCGVAIVPPHAKMPSGNPFTILSSPVGLIVAVVGGIAAVATLVIRRFRKERVR